MIAVNFIESSLLAKESYTCSKMSQVSIKINLLKPFFFAQALKRDPSNVPSAPRQIQPLWTGTCGLAYSRYIVISSINIDKLYKA